MFSQIRSTLSVRFDNAELRKPLELLNFIVSVCTDSHWAAFPLRRRHRVLQLVRHAVLEEHYFEADFYLRLLITEQAIDGGLYEHF